MKHRRIGSAGLLASALALMACSEPAASTEDSSGGTGGMAPMSTGGAAATSAGGIVAVPTGGVATGGSSGTTGGVLTGGAPGDTGGAGPATGGTMVATGGTPSTTGGASTGGSPSLTGGAPSGGTDATGGAGTGGAAAGGATAVGCDRAGLEAAADSYLAALTAGDPALMPLSASVEYVVNDDAATLAAGQGLFQWESAPDFHRHLVDVEQCRTFSEIICASWSHQYVLGVALTITDDAISQIYVVETDDGDWLFGADGYLDRSPGEDWSLISEGERLTREQLDSGARAYFAYWGDANVEVPWGDPCARLEGGSFGAFDTPLADAYTEDNQWGSCSVGIPHDGFAPQPRESIIDPDYGMVVLLLNLGGADSHLFRFVRDDSLSSRTGYDYGMVYVHTLTEQ